MATLAYEPEWRRKLVSNRLTYAYTNGLYVDIEFYLNFMGNQYCFRAHKNILAHYSTVFEEHFYKHNGKIKPFDDIDPEGLQLVLELLYKVPCSFDSADRSLIFSAYHAAKTLCIHNIENKIKEEIFNHTITSSLLTGEEFWKFLELSRILKLSDVIAELLKHAESNTKEILSARSFGIASFTTVKQILELDRLDVPEIDVLQSVVRWHKLNASEPFADDFLQGLLSSVRFRNISAKDFNEFMKGNWGIMDGRDYVKILMHLEFPVSCPLPCWCQPKFRLTGTSNLILQTKEDKRSKGLDAFSGTIVNMDHKDSAYLLDMLTEERFADVCFLVGRSKTPFKAHRNILALGSAVFERMFFGPLADSRYEIEITTDYPNGFETMVRYFYDDSYPEHTFKAPDLASMTYEVALKYGSQKLKNTCTLFSTSESLKLSAFWTHLEYMPDISTGDANKYIWQYYSKYAASNTKELLEHSSFLNASRDAVLFLLQLESLNVEEIDVLESVAKWVEFDLTRSKNLQYDLLRYIRFLDISSEEFMSFIVKHRGILSSEDSLQILLYLSDKSSKLPEWCHPIPSRHSQRTSRKKHISQGLVTNRTDKNVLQRTVRFK